MEAIIAKYEPLITWAESRLQPDDVIRIKKEYNESPGFNGHGNSKYTHLHNLYYIRDVELSCLPCAKKIIVPFVCLGAFVLFGAVCSFINRKQ